VPAKLIQQADLHFEIAGSTTIPGRTLRPLREQMRLHREDARANLHQRSLRAASGDRSGHRRQEPSGSCILFFSDSAKGGRLHRGFYIYLAAHRRPLRESSPHLVDHLRFRPRWRSSWRRSANIAPIVEAERAWEIAGAASPAGLYKVILMSSIPVISELTGRWRRSCRPCLRQTSRNER